MPDDARTRGIDTAAVALDGMQEPAGLLASLAVDALRAAGWAPPSAPASDDVKARARSAMTAALTLGLARTDGTVTTNADVIGWYVEALAAAGLLAAPSHLDRLAAEMDARDISGPCLWRRPDSGVGSWRAQLGHYGYGSTAQEAAADVLARLEATDE